jgi:hypothetical protein
MLGEIRREGNREFRSGTCPGRHTLKGRFADIDQHRLVGDGSAGGRGPASYADGDRSSRDGRIAVGFVTTSAATFAFSGWISEKLADQAANLGQSVAQLL